MEQTVADITEALANGGVPESNVPAALATVEEAIAEIGLPVGPVAGVATGHDDNNIHHVYLHLYRYSHHIVFTKQGTTITEFTEFVAGLPKDPVSIQLTNSWQPNFMYVGEMDQCTAEALDDNDLVDSWSIDALIDVEDFTNSTAATGRSTFNETVADGDAGGLHKRGNPTAQSTFVEQANSPSHLQWLSQVSRYSALTGNYYSFDDLIYNDNFLIKNKKFNPDFTIGDSPIIYVVDTGFQNDHPLAVGDQGDNLIPQTDPQSSHGRCMVSLAAGSYSGMGKNARIVTAQLQVTLPGMSHQVRVSRAFFLLMQIYHHVDANNARGKAVISMSLGVGKASLRWQANNQNPRNVFDTILDWYWSSGIATVASAGNDELSDHSITYKDLSSNLPRGAGGANTNLIVVGKSQWDTTRFPSSNYRDTGGLGILSLYNLGTDVECAVLGSAWAPELYADWTIGGVSNVPWQVKQHLINTATQYKGNNFAGDSTPRAALGETVPCTGGITGRPTGQNPRAAGGAHTLSTTQITDGSEVLLDPQSSGRLIAVKLAQLRRKPGGSETVRHV
ncbi:peptidase S8/S53 domain-containing protein [Aspergillus germanicus]